MKNKKLKGKRKKLGRGGVPEIELLCFSAFNEVSLNLLHLHETLLRLRPRHGFSLVCEIFSLPRNRNQNQKNRHSTVMEETDCMFSIFRGMPLPSRPLSFSLFLRDALPHTFAPRAYTIINHFIHYFNNTRKLEPIRA